MTILTLDRKKLEAFIGKIDAKMEESITMFGTLIEEVTDHEVSVEVFPNRPDLLSMQGFVRAFLNYLNKKPVQDYKPNSLEKDFKVVIEKSVKEVRPYTACAIVKGLKFDDEKIEEIIEIQEKLHGSYGRNRKKLAIGIYPLEQIKLPIRFLAKKPEEIKFQPLEFPKEINGRQILSQHPTGREYGDLLKDAEVFPIFEDAAGEILSMPPIINSHKTGKITEKTTDVFIECSGFHKEYLQKTLNMIVCALVDMGGKVCEMEIEDKAEGSYLSPILEPEKMKFSVDYINKNLGLELDEKEIEKCLKKMGILVENSHALIPAYRTDILHEIDLVEEVAIAYGYQNFIPEIPQISTIGEEDSLAILKRKIACLLTGLDLLEVSSYHLSTKEKQFKRTGVKEFLNDIIEVEDSKTENNILRSSLLANSIQILAENSDASYPQKIFELGKIFKHDNDYQSSETQIAEKENLCISLCYEKANFTELKQVLDYVMRMLGLNYEIKEASHPCFVEGRCGEVVVNGEKIGVIGEIAPFVLKNNKIKMPVASLEIGISALA